MKTPTQFTRLYMITCPCCHYEHTELTKAEVTKLEREWQAYVAAPDLLAACQAFMHEWNMILHEDFTDSPLGTVAKTMQAAISKAKEGL